MKRPRSASRQRGKKVNRPRPYDPDDRQFVSTHEAGHAVSAIVLGLDLKSVDIKRRHVAGVGESLGFTDTGAVGLDAVAGKGEGAAMPHIIQALTGPIAEAAVNPRVGEHVGDREDWEGARRVAAAAICKMVKRGDGRLEIASEEIARNHDRLQALLTRGAEAAARLVGAHWPAIELVAALLLQRESLTGEEVAVIVAESR